MYYIVGTVMLIVMILGFFENFAIIYTYITYKKIRRVDNLFIVGVAISDIGQAILGVPLVVLSSFSKHWIFGHYACQYYAFITTFFGISQIALLTLLAVERYFIIVRCERTLSKSFCQCLLTITASLLFGLFWALGPLTGWSSYEEEIKGIACSVSWEILDNNHLSYTISLFTVGWFIPLFIIAFSYISIAFTINRTRVTSQHTRRLSIKRCTRDRKVSVTVLFMIGAFIISWLPYSVVSMWSALGNYHSISLWAQVAPAVFAKCSIIWNPLIYVARHSCFRKAITESVSCLRITPFLCKRRNGNTTNTSALEMDKLNTNIEVKKGCNSKLDSKLFDNNNSCDGLGETMHNDTTANENVYMPPSNFHCPLKDTSKNSMQYI